VPKFFYIGTKTEGRKSRLKAKSGAAWDLGEKHYAPSPPAKWIWGSAVSSPAGFGPRLPKGFPLFSAVIMDTPEN